MTREPDPGDITWRIERLEAQKKDLWDKFSILAAVLLPAAIAFAGNEYARSMKEAEIKSQALISEAQSNVAESNIRVAQAGTVNSFFEALLSEDPARRKLAVKAVLIALPVEGPQLVQIIEAGDENEAVREAATNALAIRRNALIQSLFSRSSAERKAAYEALLKTWGGDSTLPPELILYARQNKDNKNGVFNTLVLLSNMQKAALLPHVAELKKLSYEMESNGEKTKERSEILRDRLPSG